MERRADSHCRVCKDTASRRHSTDMIKMRLLFTFTPSQLVCYTAVDPLLTDSDNEKEKRKKKKERKGEEEEGKEGKEEEEEEEDDEKEEKEKEENIISCRVPPRATNGIAKSIHLDIITIYFGLKYANEVETGCVDQTRGFYLLSGVIQSVDQCPVFIYMSEIINHYQF